MRRYFALKQSSTYYKNEVQPGQSVEKSPQITVLDLNNHKLFNHRVYEIKAYSLIPDSPYALVGKRPAGHDPRGR